MAEIRTLKLNLLADFNQLTTGLNDAQSKLNKFSSKISKAGRTASIALGALSIAGIGAVKSAEDVAIANARLGQVLEDMGVPNATKRLTAYAEELERTTTVDAEVIKLTQAKLATFSNLNKTVDKAGGAFDRATKAAIDMAAAGFGEASQNAVQLGKALQDPIKGINSLSRSGITFTAQEKELIKTMVESGDILGAQNTILEAVEMQVSGTAEATATASGKMRVAFDNVSESIGSVLLPYFQKLSDLVVKFTPQMQANADVIVAVGLAIGGLALSIKTLQFGIEAVNTVIKVATGLQWLWNAAMSANPIGLIVIGLAALAAGAVIAYNKFEPFKNLIDGLVDSVKRLGSSIANSGLGKLFGSVVSKVTGGRATGGSLNAGGVYRVGEFGPETLVMGGSSGSIRPGGASGTTVININGIVDAESARRSIERLLQDSGRRTAAVNLAGSAI